MRRLLRSLSAVGAVALSLGLHPTVAEGATDCRQVAVAHLRSASPGGFAIYQAVEPDFFASWLRCDDAQFGLSTAVHESTHRITAETDAFPLVGGGKVARPHEVSAFFAPYKIAHDFRSDDFVSIYLRRGKATSSTDFLDLLDELNAYTHDLNAAVDLKDLKAADTSEDHRDGLAAMMTFVAVYAETARAKEPRTWRGLRAPQVVRVITDLWDRGERTMAASCGVPNFGNRDKEYLRRLCAIGPQSALEQLLGRPPSCPTACLTTPEDDQARETVELTRRPSGWRKAGRVSSVQD